MRLTISPRASARLAKAQSSSDWLRARLPLGWRAHDFKTQSDRIVYALANTLAE
jgi:hypothetical protein